MLAPNVCHNSFLNESLVAIRYAGITEIIVAIYLFFKKIIFVAEPNSLIIYLCILVAESSVVAANETIKTTINVIDIFSDIPICCNNPLLPLIKIVKALPAAFLKSQPHGKHPDELIKDTPATAAIVAAKAKEPSPKVAP